jgi:drug/metabolite transporter (DMT)-like permease
VFGGLFGYFAGERLGALRLFGAAVILAGIAMSELTPVARSKPTKPATSAPH